MASWIGVDQRQAGMGEAEARASVDGLGVGAPMTKQLERCEEGILVRRACDIPIEYAEHSTHGNQYSAT